jgi:hypothetical protein
MSNMVQDVLFGHAASTQQTVDTGISSPMLEPRRSFTRPFMSVAITSCPPQAFKSHSKYSLMSSSLGELLLRVKRWLMLEAGF